MGRASPILLVLLALGFFFATYNLVTMVMHNKSGTGKWVADGLDWFDPITRKPAKVNREQNLNVRFHVVLTATDAAYSKWQCRIMYYWYKKVRDMPGSNMGGFTRVLHSGIADNLMEEIPTMVVDPLPDGLDRVRILIHVFILTFCYVFVVHPLVYYPSPKM